MRISTYNVDNLFLRSKLLAAETWDEGKAALEDVTKLNTLIAKPKYSTSDKENMKALLEKYGFGGGKKKTDLFDINQVKTGARLYKKTKTGGIEILATGRDSWVGWIQFDRTELTGKEIQNTGRVVAEVKADIQLIVEIENRIALNRFNWQVLNQFTGVPFDHNMSVVGNDRRGIDIGLLSRYPITSIISHIDDMANGDRIFSRDCPEYEILLPNKETLWILGNHLKSQGYGPPKANDEKRKLQAETVANIYKELRKGSDLVVVAGDMNDTPDSDAMKPLLSGTDLKDVMSHPKYSGLPGTIKPGTKLSQKFDYILLSPELWKAVKVVGTERRGLYSNTGESFATTPAEEASDHVAVWVDVDL